MLLRLLVFYLLILFTFVPTALTYPEESIQQCLLGIKQSPIILGSPEDNLTNWCDCFLSLTLDESKDEINSATQCGREYFR